MSERATADTHDHRVASDTGAMSTIRRTGEEDFEFFAIPRIGAGHGLRGPQAVPASEPYLGERAAVIARSGGSVVAGEGSAEVPVTTTALRRPARAWPLAASAFGAPAIQSAAPA
jgi:hypothetical protein